MDESEYLAGNDLRSRATLEELVLRELLGGLWHTTHPDRFRSILVCGAILPEPSIPSNDRWKTSQGREYYPFARVLGGISLFDFDQFDVKSYTKEYTNSSWWEFIPYRELWGRSVWIEIDRERVAPQLISRSDLVTKWNTTKAFKHSIMPLIEVTHLCRLPRRAFKRAFLAREGEIQIQELSCDPKRPIL